MTWDPTDKQGWKRALEKSPSPSTSTSPAKKVRFSTPNDINSNEAIERNKTDQITDTAQTSLPKSTPSSYDLPSTEPALMRSFFRPKSQRPPPGLVAESFRGHVDPKDLLVPRASTHVQDDGALYNVMQSPYSPDKSNLNDALTSSDASTSAIRSSIDQYADLARSSSNVLEDVAANFTASASSSFVRTENFAPVVATPPPLHVAATLMTTAFGKPGTVSSRASTPSSDRQGFLFGNGGDDLDRGHKSDYFDKIKNNPYTSSLLHRATSPSIPIPQNATEARELYKKGRYNQPKQDALPPPAVEELQKVLKDLRKRFAKIKAMCDTVGIGTASEVWESTVGIVERDRPDIKAALDKDTGKGLKEYTEGLERWDKAVGHHAILMKRMNYQEQIAALEKKIKDAKKVAAEQSQGGDWTGDGGDTGRENGVEWKGHKTRLGRRFSGLIEKN